MIRALIVGELRADPQQRTGKNGKPFALGHNPLWIAEKMHAEPAQGQKDHSQRPPAHAGKNQRAQRGKANAGPALGGDAAVG